MKPQGRRGEVAADILTDFPERFSRRKRLFVLDAGGARRELELEGWWPHKGRAVLKFRRVDSISDAEALAGCDIQLPRAERVELPEGEFYVADLLGCTVTDVASGREVGVIDDVHSGSGEALLLVVKSGTREYLLPFAQEFLKRVDIAAKRVEMSLPAGLLDLDAPLTDEEKQEQAGE